LAGVSWQWLAALVGLLLLGALWWTIVDGGRRSRPLLWCLLRPRVYRGLRRAGVRGVRGVSLVGQWFTPAQVRRLGWPGATVQLLVGSSGWRGATGIDTSGWDADAFIATVHAGGRRWSDYTASTTWFSLFRLGVEDTGEFVRYATARDPRIDIDVALRYGLAEQRIPFDVFPTIVGALERAGAKEPALMRRLLDELAVAGHRDLDGYLGGWAGLAAWVEHDAPAYVRALRRSAWEPDEVFERWLSWRGVGERAPHLQPALWHAAGFTVDEATGLLDAGDAPDNDTLAGLAALRRDS
jgi:hypothetical protein